MNEYIKRGLSTREKKPSTLEFILGVDIDPIKKG